MNVILDWALFLFICAVPLLTLLPLLRHEGWWVRGFEFPALQITTVTVAALLAYVWVYGWQGQGDKALIVLLLLCSALQCVRIIRYTRLFPYQIQSARQMRPDDQLNLLVANVLMTNRNAQPLLGLIRETQPDLVLTVETDAWWEEQLEQIEAVYPYRVKQPLDNLYGMHLYSRLELIDPQVHFLVEEGVPSMHGSVVLASGQRVALHCLHPAPPSPTENPTSAERDGELLLVAKTIDASAGPVVVMGDLNDVAWSASTRLFQKLSGLLDPRIGRGIFSTFHAGYPLLRWPLDHVFCSGDFTLVSMKRHRNIGSDHFPIQVVLQHTPRARQLHPEPAPGPGDEELAQKKIENVSADETALL